MIDQAARLRKKVKDNKRKDTGKNTRIIAIASGKGGVGKSNTTVNLGLSLQKMGESVLLIDADIGMANIDILLGLTPSYNLSHVLKGRSSFKEAIIEGPDGINILPGTSGVEDLIDISFEEVIRLLEASNQMEEDYDFVLIDIGAGIHKSVVNFIRAADEAIIVLTPEPTAIMDAYSLIKILANHDFNNNLGLLLNQVNSNNEGEKIIKRMTRAIKEYIKLNVDFVSFIPYDSYVKRSVKEQEAVISLFPHSKAGEAFRETASKLIDNRDTRPSRGMRGFIYRIIGIFNRD